MNSSARVPSTSSVILAAGGSQRLGRAKQLLKVQGVTLIRRAVEAARNADCEPIVVVLGAMVDPVKAELAEADVHTAINPHWARGVGTSIRTGFARLLEIAPACEVAFIQLSDQPLVEGATLVRLSEAATPGRICVSSYSDTVGPPVRVPRQFFSRLQNLPDQAGAKALWQDMPDQVIRVPAPEAAVDIDTEADYAALLARIDARRQKD